MTKGIIKVLFTSFFTIVLGITLFGTVAFADETTSTITDKSVLNKITITNDFVYKAIDIATLDAGKLLNTSNQNLDLKIQNICNSLITRTDNRVNALINSTANKGIVITQEYIDVTIGGTIIKVDPCCAH